MSEKLMNELDIHLVSIFRKFFIKKEKKIEFFYQPFYIYHKNDIKTFIK